MCSAIDTKFRLVHIMTGCVLFSHKVKVRNTIRRSSDGSYLIGDSNNKRSPVLEEELSLTLFGMALLSLC